MEDEEIEARAAALGYPAFVNLIETSRIARISYPTLSRLRPDQKPKTFRMAGTHLLSIDDAIEWSKRYWREYSKSGKPHP